MFWKFIFSVALFATLSNGYCPAHTRIFQNSAVDPFMACEPALPAIYFNTSHILVDCNNPLEVSLCNELTEELHNKFLSPSCTWVKISRDLDFTFNLTNGELYEEKTNFTYPLGSYVYNPSFEEAYICRENLLPGDSTDDIMLWSVMLLFDNNDTIVVNESLVVPDLNQNFTIRYYSELPDATVIVFINTSLEFLRSEVTELRKNQFELQPNWSLLETGILGYDDKLHPPGRYYYSFDGNLSIINYIRGKNATKLTRNIYPLYIVSAVFCFITMVVHLTLPKTNFHTKSLLCHVLSMMLMYVALIIRHFVFGVESKPGRILMFGFFYVTLMGTFMWLNIIAYEIWKVFARLRGTPLPKSLSNERLRLALKCLYAWGIPFLIFCIIVGITHDDEAANKIGFELARRHLPFPQSQTFYWIFIHGPITFVLAINTAFFASTIWNIKSAKNGSRILNKSVDKKLFQVFVKLFVVMGIQWLADIGSSWAEESHKYLFYVFDVINALQGVTIFLIYVCKKSICKHVLGRITHDDLSTTKSSFFSRSRYASATSGSSNKETFKRSADRQESIELSKN